MAENTEKPALNPTRPRIRLAEHIKAGHVKCWHFVIPEVRRTFDDLEVTAGVRDFVRAQLAHLGAPGEIPTSIVSLTPAGEEWLQTYGGNDS